MKITLYKGNETAQVPAIDAAGWLANGWSKESPADVPVTPAEPIHKTLDERNAELTVMEWQELKALLQGYKLPTAKPKDSNWADWAIPQILRHEGYLP